VDDFSATTGIMIEPTYTGKMLYGIYDLVKQNYFKKGQSIIALHTGGLQSIRAPR
jgi:1-aminocyclopropane-1-carboxylate deaminase